MCKKNAIDVTTIRNGQVRCVGFNRSERFFTKGKVYEVTNGSITNDNGFTYHSFGNMNALKFLSSWYEFELVESCTDKIVITTDGKTTTATKYCADGNEVTATAKCAPEDEFDFNIGAELALNRLIEKTKPVCEWRVVERDAKVGDYIRLKNNGGYHWNEVGDILKVDVAVVDGLVKVYGKNHPRKTDDQEYAWAYSRFFDEYEVVEKVEKVDPISIDGFKVGDRVNFNGVNGTVICLAASGANRIGVEFDEATDIAHNCEGIPLIAGAIGTKETSRWMYAYEIAHGEAPTYYNGKVICVKNSYPTSLCTIDGFTVGKIYEVKDGRITSNCGWTCKGCYETLEDLSNAMGNTFIPLVE